MPDHEAERLLSEFRECDQVSRAAWAALTYPIRSVNIDGYRKLVERNAAAREACDRARAAFRAYRHARRALRILLRDANPPVHIVYPCADEDRIEKAVSTFAASGLSKGDAVVLMTTPIRRQRIERRLKAATFDIAAIMSNGQLVFVDAATLLAEIMTEGTPDVLNLKARLGQIIEKASSNPAHAGQLRRVRIFGELVNLLYMAGNIPAALLVEEIDEEIIEANHSVSLFCAYSLRGNSDQLPQALLDVHSHDVSLLFK